MKNLAIAIGMASLLNGGLVDAHARLERAVPANGSVLVESPKALSLTFSQSVRLTALWLQKDGSPKQSIASLPITNTANIAVALPALTPGVYTVTWRLLGEDGHIASGAVHFTIATTGTKDHR